jgi:hypothetical protein
MMRIFLLVLLVVFAPAAFAQTDLPEKDNNTLAVDVALVLAVDVSFSTLKDELTTQRDSYAEAIASSEFLDVLKSGAIGKVAVTYFEWSGFSYQNVIVPWRVIDGPEAAAAVAAEIAKAPALPKARTSISGAINFAASLLDNSPYRGARRVIHIPAMDQTTAENPSKNRATGPWPRVSRSTVCPSWSGSRRPERGTPSMISISFMRIA